MTGLPESLQPWVDRVSALTPLVAGDLWGRAPTDPSASG